MKSFKTADLLFHLREELGLRKDDIVFVFSRLWGLGRPENGPETITQAFRECIPEGLLIVPTFSYSWCKSEEWSAEKTPCPEMGTYPEYVRKTREFIRTDHPNFSVAALKTRANEDRLGELFHTGPSSFGVGSVFSNLVEISKERRVLILLLGGVFDDCLFRCTFIHYVQQKTGCSYRYLKSFNDPARKRPPVDQLVRYLSAEEYQEKTGDLSSKYRFPLEEDFGPFGKDLVKASVLRLARFGYSESRMVELSDFVRIFEGGLLKSRDYGLSEKCIQRQATEVSEERGVFHTLSVN